ncbi:hypothetical protein QBC35DRAFT_371798, partial [Podospora australis]
NASNKATIMLSPIDRIAIACIVIYTPALLIACFLAYRHGFGKRAGRLFLIILSLSRLIDYSMQLATIKNPTNSNLVIGANVLASVGVSALVATMASLLERVLASIRREGSDPLVKPITQDFAQLAILAGMILSIIGGTSMGSEIGNAIDGVGPPVEVSIPVESQVGVGLIMGGFAITALGTFVTLAQLRAVEKGEKRLLIALLCVIPFTIVRLVFAGLATYGSDTRFRSWGGAASYVWWFLGLSVIMEIIAVAILEDVGLTLKKLPKTSRGERFFGSRYRRRNAGAFGPDSKAEEGMTSSSGHTGVY